MPTVICKYPVTYNGTRYKPGDIFEVDEKYIDEVSKCCDCVELPEDSKNDQDSGKTKTRKASK